MVTRGSSTPYPGEKRSGLQPLVAREPATGVRMHHETNTLDSLAIPESHVVEHVLDPTGWQAEALQKK